MRARVLLAVAVVFVLSYGLLWAADRGLGWWQNATTQLKHTGLPWVEVGRESKTFDLGGARKLTIESQFGTVDVAPGGPNAMVEVVKKARGEDLADARERGKNLKVSGRPEGQDGFRIFAGQEKADINTMVDLVVRLPAGTALRIEMGAGEVRVRGMEGPVTIEADVGEIVVADIRGPVEVRSRVGEVNLRDVSSQRITTSVDIGEIEVRLSEPFRGELRAKTRIGSITIAVPSGSQCRVKTGVGVGTIDDDLPAGVVSRRGPGLIEARTWVGEVCLVEAG